MPAKAGIQFSAKFWIPACAGMSGGWGLGAGADWSGAGFGDDAAASPAPAISATTAPTLATSPT
jgi:hypothetical protein